MIEINLLPWREDLRQQQWKNLFLKYIISLFFVFMILTIIQFGLHYQVKHQQKIFNKRLALWKSQPISVKSQVDPLWEFKIHRIKALKAILVCLMRNNAQLAINDFSFKQKNFSIKGVSVSPEYISILMKELLAIETMDLVKIISLKSVGNQAEFNLLIVER